MFELPKLPYDYDALEPHISRKTLEFHHDKHHAAYVEKTNKLAKGTKFEEADLKTIIKLADGGLFNNGAQVWNHTFFFEQFSPDPKTKPEGKLMEAIEKAFDSYENFREKFDEAATTLFGSGWAWLVKNPDGILEIVQTSNAGNPIHEGNTPLVTCDVWEHAYYLDVQNKRPDYIENFWKVLDWKVVEQRFEV
ncbi:MAG: superoxide dismutase [Bacteroidales bacterium]